MSAPLARSLWFWLAGLAVFFLSVFLLRSILLPFVAGMAVAYLIDPWCDRMEARGLSRTWATTIVTLIFAVVVLVILLLLVPLAIQQLTDFINRIPSYFAVIRGQVSVVTELVEARLPPETLERVREFLLSYAGKIGTWLTGVLGGLVSGGVAVANLLSLLFITPIVAFYLLRDWDRIIATVDSWLPLDHADTIRDLARQIDSRMAGFLRGQGAVCLILGVFYATALSLTGLDFGLVIGLLAGLVSFIPFVGSILGFVVSVGLALLQFDSLTPVGVVAAVFLVGQMVEGNFLTPKLVGDKIGLHPVWVMFGLLAGGALFGFVGVLLAVPMAAAVGVMARFGITQYLASPYYRGNHGRESHGADPGRPPGQSGDTS